MECFCKKNINGKNSTCMHKIEALQEPHSKQKLEVVSKLQQQLQNKISTEVKCGANAWKKDNPDNKTELKDR